ncbi:prepronociceptin isoform X2 [Alligator mississippiensis]|uniref:prepronociceptin isoform X2 n=1 Tax=Alligator mississippiensis TaxID=8496 RepID=UPI0003D0ECA1|nr:prepronociceptin isoform X2 [Alligator mississippiensis]
MRALLRDLLLLCLLAHVLGDCQRDCLACSRLVYNQPDSFNVLVCIVECEGKVFSSGTWELCSKVAGKATLQLSADSLEEDVYQPLDAEDGDLFGGGLKRYNDLTKVVDLSKVEDEKRVSKVSGLIRQREAEDGASDGSETQVGDFPEQPKDISKRLGDFLNGKYSYRQVLEPAVSGVQKRYGGFIGVRKSARKWNNQKRFSEFLKQYLGMSPRSSEYDGIGNDLNEQNEI